MSNINIFEAGTRQQLRFDSVRGQLNIEQLWELPLLAKNNFDLDTIAKEVNNTLKDSTEESFVKQAKPTAAAKRAELKLDIVKHIIAVKQEEAEAAKQRAARAAERDRLVTILADKQDDALKGMSVEEIKKRLGELDDDASATTATPAV